MEQDRRLEWSKARQRADMGLVYSYRVRVARQIARRLCRAELSDNLEADRAVERIWSECSESGDQDMFLRSVKAVQELSFPPEIFIERLPKITVEVLLSNPERLIEEYAKYVRPWVPAGALVFPSISTAKGLDKDWVLHTLYETRSFPDTLLIVHSTAEGEFQIEPLTQFTVTHLGG